MKKLFALILAGAMAISMVACSSKGSDNSGDTDSEGKLKVQLIVSNLGDKSFNDSADASLKEMQSEGLIDYTVVEFGNDNSKAEPTMQEAADTMLYVSTTSVSVLQQNGSAPTLQNTLTQHSLFTMNLHRQ